MSFSRSETKNHRDIHVPFPVPLMVALDQYLFYRCKVDDLLRSPNALWPSRVGIHQSGASIRESVKQVTGRVLGYAHSPHMFRYAAATSLAIDLPEEIMIANVILGNDFLTMQEHYNKARMVSAAEQVHQALDARREAAVGTRK